METKIPFYVECPSQLVGKCEVNTNMVLFWWHRYKYCVLCEPISGTDSTLLQYRSTQHLACLMSPRRDLMSVMKVPPSLQAFSCHLEDWASSRHNRLKMLQKRNLAVELVYPQPFSHSRIRNVNWASPPTCRPIVVVNICRSWPGTSAPISSFWFPAILHWTDCEISAQMRSTVSPTFTTGVESGHAGPLQPPSLHRYGHRVSVPSPQTTACQPGSSSHISGKPRKG